MPPLFPSLQTARLLLRELAVRDLPRVAVLANDVEIAANTLNIPYPYSEEDALTWLSLARQGFWRSEAFTFAIELKQTQEFIGAISLHVDQRFDRAEAGYWLGRPYWNQGIITEALAGVLRFGFEELKLNKIFATHFAYNTASGRVMVKNGMLKEGELVQHIKRNGHYHDLWCYGLTRSEYERLPPS